MSEDKFQFEFTVISAVYKAEAFLPCFFESMLAQSIGFSKIQIIAVDDGSPDGSGKICDEYAARYPENISVIHTENRGASAARTEGLKHARGRYITFTDPDDTLEPGTMESVLRFFSSQDSKVKVAAIPIRFFGSQEGEHHLNKKFRDGERVISLLEDGNHIYPQLSISSCFIKADIAANISFKPELIIAEDAEEINKILIDHPYLGVVPDACYNYRRYPTSQVASAKDKRAWYIPYLLHFSLSSMSYATERLGYIPRFIQYTVMCDLQWKLLLRDEPTILDEKERNEFYLLINKCLTLIDADIIAEQGSISDELKLLILEEKARLTGDKHRSEYRPKLLLDHLTNDRDCIRISARALSPAMCEAPELYITVGDEQIYAAVAEDFENERSLGRAVSHYTVAEFTVPKELLSRKKCYIEFKMRGCDALTLKNGVAFPLSLSLKNAYAERGGMLFRLIGSGICVTRSGPLRRNLQNLKFIFSLLSNGGKGTKKAAMVRAILPFLRLFKRKPLWIISDRMNKASDNGEAFFRYLEQINYKGAKYLFAINKSTPDYKRLEPIGKMIDRGSAGYKIKHLLADKIISSHADEFVTNPFFAFKEPYLDMLTAQDFIFLQHGVIKDDLSGWLNRYSKNIRGFITSAKAEYRSIIDTPSYHYTEREIWLTGLPRFDRLYRDEKKYITVMPTWRRYIMDGIDTVSGEWNESASFASSEYFRFYNALINDVRLLDAADRLGYKICYMPHPNIIKRTDIFNKDPRVKFFTIDDEYRDVYAWSDLILTDYSSAVFDFAYLRKPVVYTQFDKEEFFRGEHVYTKGYFDYERDGFGEVVYDLDATVDILISYMESGCALRDIYKKRIDSFFAFSDRCNSKRILELIEKNK